VAFSIASTLMRSCRTGLGLFLQKSTQSCSKTQSPRVLPYGNRSSSFLVLPSLIFFFLGCRCLSLGFELFFGQLTGMRMNMNIDVSSCGLRHVLPPLAFRIVQGCCSSVAVDFGFNDLLDGNQDVQQTRSSHGSLLHQGHYAIYIRHHSGDRILCNKYDTMTFFLLISGRQDGFPHTGE